MVLPIENRHIKGDELTESIRSQVIELMVEGFGDYRHLYEGFMERVAVPLNTLYVATSPHERVIASLHAVPYGVKEGNEHYDESISYMYALVTDPNYRGKGIMRSLLQFAMEHRFSQFADIASVLIPADERLQRYYEKQGFRNFSNPYSLEIEKECPDDEIIIFPSRDVDVYFVWEAKQLVYDDDAEEGPLDLPMIFSKREDVLKRLDKMQLYRPLL